MRRRRPAPRCRLRGLSPQRFGCGRRSQEVGSPIGLVPAGERWPDGSLRVAAEDALGAGAIAAALHRLTFSPEVQLAVAQFTAASAIGLRAVLAEVASGRELIADGYGEDVRLAADLDASEAAPRLVDGVLQA